MESQPVHNHRLAHIFSEKHASLIGAQVVVGDLNRRIRVASRIKLRKANDPVFRAACNLRNRLRSALKAQTAWKQGFGMLGCTMAGLKLHLEHQFTEGMTWGNYGLWHIDHIRPVSSFDLLDEAQQRQCFHFTNLQPLWATDNQSKGKGSKESPSAYPSHP